MPTPVSGENWQNWVARCMSDSESADTFPDTDQRLAFCLSRWEKNKTDENEN